MRIYDPRAGRFLSVDPIAREYPWYSPYQFAGNMPIWAVDLDGLEQYYSADGSYIGKSGKSTEIRVITKKETIAIAKDALKHPNWNHEWLRNSYHSQQAYTNPDQAALDWAYEYNPQTAITQIRYTEVPYAEIQQEFGAMIGSLETKDEKGSPITLYTLGPTIPGESSNNVDILKSQTLEGWKRTYGVHTHPGMGNMDSDEEFSDRDNNMGLNGDKEISRSHGFKFYLATPRGKLRLYDPATDSAIEIASGVPRMHGVEVVENGRFKDSHGRERTAYKIIYKRIAAPILKTEAEKKK